MAATNRTAQVFVDNKEKILEAWSEAQMTDLRIRSNLLTREEWSGLSRQFIDALVDATSSVCTSLARTSTPERGSKRWRQRISR
jgi:hypothetical protein